MRFKLLFLILLVCLGVQAQTNVIFVKAGGLNSGNGNPNLKGLKVVLTDTSVNPRMINGIFISPQPWTVTTISSGIAYFTNVIWGIYDVKLSSFPEVHYTIQVNTNTTGLVDAGLLTSITNQPNPLSDFYTIAQVDTLFSDVQFGLTNLTGDVNGYQSNNNFSAQGLGKITNIVASLPVTLPSTLTNNTTGNATRATNSPFGAFGTASGNNTGDFDASGVSTNFAMTTSNNIVQGAKTSTNTVFVETFGNDTNAIAGNPMFPFRNLDAAVQFASNNYAIMLGYGTFAFTNFITNSVQLFGKGSRSTFLVAYTAGNPAGSPSSTAIFLQDNTQLRGFDIEPQPTNSTSTVTNYQPLIGFQSSSLAAPVLQTFNNALLEDVATTNGGSDCLFFGTYNFSTNILIRNCSFRAVADTFVDLNANMVLKMYNTSLNSFGISLYSGFIGQGSALRLEGGTSQAASSYECYGCSFRTANTNGYPVNILSRHVSLIGCTYTNLNPSGGTLTNINNQSAAALGSSFMRVIGADIPASTISMGAASLIYSGPNYKAIPTAGVIQTDGTNLFSSDISSFIPTIVYFTNAVSPTLTAYTNVVAFEPKSFSCWLLCTNNDTASKYLKGDKLDIKDLADTDSLNGAGSVLQFMASTTNVVLSAGVAITIANSWVMVPRGGGTSVTPTSFVNFNLVMKASSQ